jgi:cytosine/adenosine deaminase-related metal-dependent hydrolase
VIPRRHSATAGVSFINAELPAGKLSSLRVLGSRIAGVGLEPLSGDIVVDLDGARLLPGLINAHDHLQLNSLPSLDANKRYGHVQEWIADINHRRRSDVAFEARVAIARNERLLIGGVKNLLSGVTTVAHHDPLYPELSSHEFPTRVVQNYGWSHSLYIDGEEPVRDSYAKTPVDWPWTIHAAEGIDEAASREFDRLDALGCIGPNTLLVHGVALRHEQRVRLDEKGAGLIWCPASNMRLFGRTTEVGDLITQNRVALGTDSRLSGARDMLEEMRMAADLVGLDESVLLSLATRIGARLLRLTDRGCLRVGARADLLVLPPKARLTRTSRSDIRLVLIDGVVRYGDEDCATAVSSDAHWVSVKVDGRRKILDAQLTARLSSLSAREEGLELPRVTRRVA